SGGTGRRAGLKIRWGASPVWVRLPPSALGLVESCDEVMAPLPRLVGSRLESHRSGLGLQLPRPADRALHRSRWTSLPPRPPPERPTMVGHAHSCAPRPHRSWVVRATSSGPEPPPQDLPTKPGAFVG